MADFKYFVYWGIITMKTNAHASVRVPIELLAKKKLSFHVPQHLAHPCLSTVGTLDIYA